jgi:ribosome maturation factor RimP
MNEENKIREMIQERLEGTDIFVVELSLKPGDLLEIYIDGDHEIGIDDCVRLSKHLEHRIEKEFEEANYEIRVCSYGADQPLLFPRQISKAVGKMVLIKDAEGKKLKGMLTAFDGLTLTLEPIKPSAVKGVKDKKEEARSFSLDGIKEIRRAIVFQ